MGYNRTATQGLDGHVYRKTVVGGGAVEMVILKSKIKNVSF